MCVAGWAMFLPGLDLYHADPAQHLISAGEDLSDLSDLPGPSEVRNVPFHHYSYNR